MAKKRQKRRRKSDRKGGETAMKMRLKGDENERKKWRKETENVFHPSPGPVPVQVQSQSRSWSCSMVIFRMHLCGAKQRLMTRLCSHERLCVSRADGSDKRSSVSHCRD
ncbi:hypothetical protein WMY93_022425 [Mugilogobius chulae]|uniref:Uncharacterized protein n=1 Tax=Mugilogobius chulae TaxID=88201 RepID=A0AAW0N8H0_9GOBI